MLAWLSMITLAIGLLAASGVGVAGEEPAYLPRADDELVPQMPYQRYFTRDAFDREITFYVSEEPEDTELPLMVYVQGSGAQSLFYKDQDGRMRGGGGHLSVSDAARGRARLVIVEKPGVSYLDAPDNAGGAIDASAQFREEHTLERWCEAIHAAMCASRVLPGVSDDRLLVVGHSEGGLVAAKLSAEHPWITHVAVLAGGGPTQLFDLTLLAREGAFFSHVSDDPVVRANHVLESWREIQADPDNAEKLWFGHPYRRWSTFMRTSTCEQLLKSEANVFVSQGAADDAVSPASFEALRTELLARGRDGRFELIEGADHSYSIVEADGRRVDGWTPLHERIVDWFAEG